ncbi:hypothetical protein TEQG_08772, partial [Trichophyton equinum CBS 127.97]
IKEFSYFDKLRGCDSNKPRAAETIIRNSRDASLEPADTSKIKHYSTGKLPKKFKVYSIKEYKNFLTQIGDPKRAKFSKYTLEKIEDNIKEHSLARNKELTRKDQATRTNNVGLNSKTQEPKQIASVKIVKSIKGRYLRYFKRKNVP